MIHVIARMEVNPGCMEQLLEVMKATVPKVLAEKGCIEYCVCRDEDPALRDRFLTIVEAWETRELHKAHLAAPHMADYRVAVKPLRAGNTVYILEPEFK